MTITTGAALAPDDDESPDAEGEDTGILLEAGASQASASSHVFVPHVIRGISLTVAPDVVSDSVLAVPPDLGSKVQPTLGPDLVGGDALAVAPDTVTPETDSPLLSVTALSTTEAAPVLPRLPLSDRVLAALPFTGAGLTGLGGVALGCLVVGVGAAGDLALGNGLGPGFSATFLLGCVLVAGALRTRALALAIVLPPLLFAGSLALETTTSGQTVGRREMALDVATSLALQAPLLFIGTAVAVALVLVRVAVHLSRR